MYFIQHLNKNDKFKKNSSTNDINKLNENSNNNSLNGLEDFFKNLNLSKPLQVKFLFSSQHLFEINKKNFVNNLYFFK